MRHVQTSRLTPRLVPRLLIPALALAALAAFGEPLPGHETAVLAEAVPEVEAAVSGGDALQALESNVRELKAMRIRLVLTLPAVGR